MIIDPGFFAPNSSATNGTLTNATTSGNSTVPCKPVPLLVGWPGFLSLLIGLLALLYGISTEKKKSFWQVLLTTIHHYGVLIYLVIQFVFGSYCKTDIDNNKKLFGFMIYLLNQQVQFHMMQTFVDTKTKEKWFNQFIRIGVVVFGFATIVLQAYLLAQLLDISPLLTILLVGTFAFLMVMMFIFFDSNTEFFIILVTLSLPFTIQLYLEEPNVNIDDYLKDQFSIIQGYMHSNIGHIFIEKVAGFLAA
ncbi:hypothetical protein HDV01_004419 [Terramyces sp. JEL0728]|nr:hypothetical protein HDV01_004419 [Terramyces sp. JEL0728]